MASANRHQGATRALPLAFAWAPLATAIVAMTMLVACQREADLPPLPPARLDAAQTQALQQMNAAGATAFAGWTWRYEFGAGCRLRVIKRYEDRPRQPHLGGCGHPLLAAAVQPFLFSAVGCASPRNCVAMVLAAAWLCAITVE